MSLILDALRKSDVERSRQQAPQVAGTASAPPERPRRAWVAPVVVLLALNAALLAWLLLRPAPADGEDGAGERPVASVPAPGVGLPDPQPAAAPTTAPAAPPRPKAAVRSLADESRVTAASATRVAATDEPAGASREAGAAASTEATDTAANASPPAADAALADARALIDRGVVPADALAVELHVFGTDPARRFAFVGGRKVGAGDTLAAGIDVVEIVRDGVVIEHRGTRYLLRRD